MDQREKLEDASVFVRIQKVANFSANDYFLDIFEKTYI